MYKTHHSRTTFGSFKVEFRKSPRRCGAKHISKWKCNKTHHSRTTFGSWDVEFRKSARRCGAKQISKSKCPKHTMFGPLLEAEMSSCEKVHAVVARSTVPSQHVKNTRVSDYFRRFRCRFASLHFNSLHYTTWHDTTLHFERLRCSSVRPGPAQQIDRWIER